MGISRPEFEYLRKFMREGSAIVLDEDKQYLAESRLAPLLIPEGFPSVQKLLERMRGGSSSPLHRKVLDAMTNNETWFYRDLAPYDALRTEILPQIIKRREVERRLNIWSAASSSGQEAYSLSMLLLEHFPGLSSWKVQILATDISNAVLERAKRACYSKMEVNRGLPIHLLAKYFTRSGLEWQLSERVRSMVTFRLMNLAESWPDIGSIDVLMLRNVLIYFDVDMKRQILARVERVLSKDGVLFLGCAETTLNLSDRFERVQYGAVFCYRLCR